MSKIGSNILQLFIFFFPSCRDRITHLSSNSKLFLSMLTSNSSAKQKLGCISEKSYWNMTVFNNAVWKTISNLTWKHYFFSILWMLFNYIHFLNSALWNPHCLNQFVLLYNWSRCNDLSVCNFKRILLYLKKNLCEGGSPGKLHLILFFIFS